MYFLTLALFDEAYEYERRKRKAINDIKAVNDAEGKEGGRYVQGQQHNHPALVPPPWQCHFLRLPQRGCQFNPGIMPPIQQPGPPT
ncbi:hypothetical protein GBF38_018979 [Nibea albiflora]|uniref:Uncharacterized protein n=1 Tax=Nibea albiflora TaxID=240163 RepID=A0ACB7END8_NIBAL|nr:hypothetical protein GBF38_018979 [Nibea albiflora]